MNDTLVLDKSRMTRMLLGLMFSLFAFMFISTVTSQPAFAACPPGNICAGTGTSPGTGMPSGPTGSPAQQIAIDRGGALAPTRPAPPSPPYPGVGVNVAALTKTWTQIGSASRCAVRDDGKAALQAVDTYGQYVLENVSGVNPGPGWVSAGRAMNGTYYWTKTAMLSTACKYPPRVYYSTVMCSISQSVQAAQVAPSNKNLGISTTGTGYAENAGSLSSCYGAYGSVSMNQPITEYGFYNIYTWQRMQAVRVEIAYTANEVTGAMPAPRIVGRSPAYNTTKYLAQTASLDCQNGFRTPGINRTDWTDTPCQGSSYVCVRQPIQFDVGDGTNVSMLGSASGSMQLMRDGKARKVVFNQTPQGSSISVNGGLYKTTFYRDGLSTPWDPSKMWDKNLFDLSTSATGKSVLSQGNGTKSPTYSGRVNNTWMTAIQAGVTGQPTKIRQELFWGGTRSVRSGVISSINANTGAVSWTARMISVPTSGICNQTASVDYIRAIGDSVR